MSLAIRAHITFSLFAIALICKVLTGLYILCERLALLPLKSSLREPLPSYASIIGNNVLCARIREGLSLFVLCSLVVCLCPEQLLAQSWISRPYCTALPAPTGNIVRVSAANASNLPSIVHGVAAGTTVLLEDGVYTVTSYIQLNKPGVSIRSVSGNPDSVVIDGAYQGYIFLIVAENVTIADVTIKRSQYHLVHVSGGGHHVNLHNLRLIDAREQFIKENPSSTGVYADYGTVSCSSFELTETGRTQVNPTSGGCYTGGVDVLAAQGWTVRDNYFKNIYCTNGGLPTHMVLFWHTSRDPIVERNVIVNCARGIGFGLGSTGNYRTYPDNPTSGISGDIGHIGGIIRNNMIYGNIGSYFDTGIGIEQALNVEVYNNTVFSTGGTFSSIDSRFINSNPIIKNNLVAPNMTIRNGATPTYAANLQGAASAMFRNSSEGNLHLVQTVTQTIDKGVMLGVKVLFDIDGNSRGEKPDIGADEFTSGALKPMSPMDLNVQ